MGHIPTKLHQLLFSSFLDFVQTDIQTDRWRQKQHLPMVAMYHLFKFAELVACFAVQDGVFALQRRCFDLVLLGRLHLLYDVYHIPAN